MGRPEPAPFVPDRFQVEAVERVRDEDILVSAPTGSGKTWIAVEAAKEFLARGVRVWYATPLKALSNAKYLEFGDIFGEDSVGILTGDRKEKPDAPVIVGTTEILRNQLYDAMQTGEDLDVDLVILDEAHYLGDADRGVVWEEVLIYLPPRVRLLLLSATISNASDIARWLTQIRESTCNVVVATERPVPLHVLFRHPDGSVFPFLKGEELHPAVAQWAKTRKKDRAFRHRNEQDVNEIVHTLREHDLLPAIVFLKSRADCDRALDALEPSPVDAEEGGFSAFIHEELKKLPELATSEQVEKLLRCRAGSHHAGKLPAWRLLVEKLMVNGHLEVILSTSTVAAGVNFPARTVVILQSDRFDGRAFVDLTSTELHQMTGRAGRRGMDNAGYTLVVPGKHLHVKLIRELVQSPPEPLQSRITVNFSMVLNLLISHDPDGVRELLGLSFASFHSNPRKAKKTHRRLLDAFHDHMSVLQDLEYIDENGEPTQDGLWAAKLRLDHPLLIGELIRTGAFEGLQPAELAGLIAPFVIDKDREIFLSRSLWNISRPLWKKFRTMLRGLRPLADYLGDREFDVPPIMFWPAAAALFWGKEVDWFELAESLSAAEGDLAMLMLRTADHLRQLAALEEEYPEVARAARQAIPLLLRPPIV